MYKNLLFVLFLGLMALVGSCDKGELAPTSFPSTTIFVDTIIVAEDERLQSRVDLRWAGYSADDYIIGYKVVYAFQPIQNPAALFDTVQNITTRTDSTFQFIIPRGNNIANVYFSIQAVTSRGQKDPKPPVLRIPIVNTPPVSRWDAANLPTSNNTLAVLSLPFAIDDFDGVNTIDSVQIRANFGPWVTIPRTINLVSLVAENPKQEGVQNARIFSAPTGTNPNPNLLGVRLPNFRNGGTNNFEIRVIDASGAISRPDTTPDFFVRAQTGDLLVLEAHYSDSLLPFYRNNVFDNVVAPRGVDYITFSQNNEQDQPKAFSPTVDLLISLYDAVYFYNDVRNSTDDPYLLETLYQQFREYLRTGGKLILSSPFPKAVEALSSNSPIFSLIPVNTAGFGPAAFSVQVARLNNNRDLVSSSAATASGYPMNLRTSTAFPSIDPFNITPDSDTLYTAPGINNQAGNYSGTRILAAKKRNAEGRTNLVYFSVELHKLNGNNQSLKQLFSHILNNEFNW